MEQDLVKLRLKLDSLIRDAKIIMWLSLISLITIPLFLVSLIYFLFYRLNLSKLKNDQSFSGIFDNMRGKTTKELKSLQGSSEPLEQGVIRLLLAHKSMVAALIIVGIIIAIIIGVISRYYYMGWQVV